MTAYMRESYESQPIEMSATEVRWPVTHLVYNVPDEFEALKYAFFHLDQTKNTLPLDRLRVGSRVGLTTWAIEAEYNSKRAEAINKDATEGSSVPGIEAEEVDYQLSGENRNIKQSLETTGHGTFFKPAPDEGGAIGRDKSSVKGVDVPFPVVQFTVRRQWQRQDITLLMRDTWERTVGKVNDDTYRGYERGEVRLEGVSLSLKGLPTQLIPVTFTFAVRFNEADVEFDSGIVDDPIVVGDVEGWHVLDQRFEEKEDTDANAMIRRLTYVYKHRVLDYADFSALGV